MTTAKKPSKPAKPSKAKPRPGPKNQQRGSSAVGERGAHNPDVVGSTPTPATKSTEHSAAVLAHLSGLKPKPRAFAVEYLKDKNATQAYIRAGYSARGNSAEVNAARLLRNAQVSAAIAKAEQEMLAKVQEDTGITLERTLREIARGAFHDPRRFFDESGGLKQIVDLDDDTAAALAGFDVTELNADGAVIGYVKKIKLGDRKGYLDMLMKHLGGYKVDNDQKGKSAADALREFFAHLHAGAGRLPIVKSNPLVRG